MVLIFTVSIFVSNFNRERKRKFWKMDTTKFLYFLTILNLIFINIAFSFRPSKNLIITKRKHVDYEKIANCTNFMARHFFTAGKRIVMICEHCSVLGSKIARSLMRDHVIVITNEIVLNLNRRVPGHMIVDQTHDLRILRNTSITKAKFSAISQFLIVTVASEKAIEEFHQTTWNVRFWNMAFLTFNENYEGTISRPTYTRVYTKHDFQVKLKAFGYCTAQKSQHEVESSSAFFRRLCTNSDCSIRYAGVADDTVKYWRGEDKLRLKDKVGFETVGTMLLRKFGDTFNISIDNSFGRNLSWETVDAMLSNNEVDVVTALMPRDRRRMENLQIVCTYMLREMKFAANIQQLKLDNHIQKLLMPFNYTVWLCIMLISALYLAFLILLRTFHNMGLIKEYLTLMKMLKVMFLQDVEYPRKTSLRFVLAMWMVFVLYINIVYNSIFSSSMARLDTDVMFKSLEEIQKSKQPLGGPNIVEDYFNDSSDPVVMDLAKRYQIMTSDQAFVAMFNKNMIGVVQHFTVDRMNWVNKGDRRLRIYTLPSPVLSYPVLFITRRGHPYRHYLRRNVLLSQESGLLTKWLNFFVTNENKRVTHVVETEMLNMKHLIGIFYIFLICHAVNIFVFFMEIMSVRLPIILRNKKKERN